MLRRGLLDVWLLDWAKRQSRQPFSTMAGDTVPDYQALYLQERERRLEEKELNLKEREQHQKEKEQHQKEKEQHQKEKEQHEKARVLLVKEEEKSRQTTFEELIRYGHNLLSRPLRAGIPSRSTTGKLPPPTGKYCPTRLVPWADCESRQQEIYTSVHHLLHPANADPRRLFNSQITLQQLGEEAKKRPITSEQDLLVCERFFVENHVHAIIAGLCDIPGAQQKFRLGNGVWFDNHANGLDEVQGSSKPDQFCIHRVDSNTSTLLTTVEYKPPHKLSVENLRVGLRPMNPWTEVATRETIPSEPAEHLKYNAELLTCCAVAQEFHVMIQEGLEYSYVTNGLSLVLLRVPHDEPGTLYYHLCEPNMEINEADGQSFLRPMTAISRVLCLCLMSFNSSARNQEWRNDAKARLPIWRTSFEHALSQIPTEQLRQDPSSEHASSSLGYLASSSPPPQQSTRRTNTRGSKGGQSYEHTNKFCTQQCLLGLQKGVGLDENCPNVNLHQQGQDSNQHQVSADGLVQALKLQLDENIDHNCTPIGPCGSYGAPFKITSTAYGYTVVGKGTTTWLWKEVSHEADVYHVLRRAQGSAVPVFLGSIDLAKTYFLHGAGEIQHMLLMGWGGESTSKITIDKTVRREISRSRKEIRSLGVLHQDLRWENILWNTELRRALIIDFHRAALDRRPMEKRTRVLKRSLSRADEQDSKRRRVA